MHINKNNKIIKMLLTAFMASIFLVACDDAQKKTSAIKVPVQTYKQQKLLKGSVTDEEGAVLEGDVTVADSSGKVVATTQLAGKKTYSVTIPAGTALPIVLTVKQKGKSDKLRAVVISAAVSKYDISSLTTKIANRAKELGGYTYANMVQAADSTVGVPDANKTSTGFRGDPTKQYGGWH